MRVLQAKCEAAEPLIAVGRRADLNSSCGSGKLPGANQQFWDQAFAATYAEGILIEAGFGGNCVEVAGVQIFAEIARIPYAVLIGVRCSKDAEDGKNISDSYGVVLFVIGIPTARFLGNEAPECGLDGENQSKETSRDQRLTHTRKVRYFVRESHRLKFSPCSTYRLFCSLW